MMRRGASLSFLTFGIGIALALGSLPGCGNGGGGSSSNNPPGDNRATDAQALADAPLTKGRSTRLRSSNGDADGASLIAPPGAVDQDADIVIAATDTPPVTSPWGQGPIGSLFDVGPSGLIFHADNHALLTLPLSPGGVNDTLHIGRWNETAGGWEDVGGTITGDFISAEVDHLSLYGVFPKGKSLVRVRNDVAPAEDPGNLGIGIRYISGPLPPRDWPATEPFPAHRPLPEGGIDLKIGESRLMSLPPGQYHFAVSFPSPFQVANSMHVRIPALGTGADDTTVDQTITITGDGASSDDAATDGSLARFLGNWTVTGSNQRPALSCSATVPTGVAVANIDPGAAGLPSRRISVGPIVSEHWDLSDVELTGTAVDPEGSAINYFWTLNGPGTLPTRVVAASGEKVGRAFRPNPTREGRYDVYLTAYDSFDLFDECRWEITVRGNEKPTIKVMADDYVVDFGRFGSERIGGVIAGDRQPLGPPTGGAASWCNYVDTNSDGTPDTTLLRRLPILPANEAPDHLRRPTQYPAGMTCLYALVGDADGDPLTVRFGFPFGGDLYSALTGEKFTTLAQLDAYNALLSTSAAGFPVPPVLASFAPGAGFAFPIIWEAPDNIWGLSSATHDCRHLKMDPASDVGLCIDIPGTYPAGGITAIVATVTDGFSREQIDDFGVGYGEDRIVRLDGNNGGGGSGGGSGGSANRPPTCSGSSVSANAGESVSVPLSGSDPDGDPLTYRITGQPAHGSWSGGFYTPVSDYSGSDSFTFVANDGQADSSACTVSITVTRVRKWYVFRKSGVGYQKTWATWAIRVSGYQLDAHWLYPEDVAGVIEQKQVYDNTAACQAGPPPLPDLPPHIWEAAPLVVKVAGPLDKDADVDPYRCAVPSFVTSGPIICNQWVNENCSLDDIRRICGN